MLVAQALMEKADVARVADQPLSYVGAHDCLMHADRSTLIHQSKQRTFPEC